MITVSIFFIFAGVFLGYNTSTKITVNGLLQIELWSQSNNKTAKILGALMSFFALLIELYYLGVAVGIIFWLLANMLILSLWIVVRPLAGFSFNYVLIAFLLSLIFEIL